MAIIVRTMSQPVEKVAVRLRRVSKRNWLDSVLSGTQLVVINACQRQPWP